MKNTNSKKTRAQILGILAICIAIVNIGWLFFFAIIFRIILYSLGAFFIGISATIGSLSWVTNSIDIIP